MKLKLIHTRQDVLPTYPFWGENRFASWELLLRELGICLQEREHMNKFHGKFGGCNETLFGQA